MYIPVPCPPNGETPEMGSTSDVLPPSVLSAAAQSLALNGTNSAKGPSVVDSATGQANCCPTSISDGYMSKSVTNTPSLFQMSPSVEMKALVSVALPFKHTIIIFT